MRIFVSGLSFPPRLNKHSFERKVAASDVSLRMKFRVPGPCILDTCRRIE